MAQNGINSVPAAFCLDNANGTRPMFKFIGGTIGIIFIIGLLVVIGILSLIF